MADRDLQAILNSGEITNIFIGGVTSDDRVVIFSDLTGANIDFDNTSTSLTSSTVQAALAELANVGYAHMVLATPYSGGQTLSTTPQKLSLFDTIDHDVNGAVTPLVDTSEAIPAHSFTIDKTGTFQIYGTVEAEFSASNEVTIELYKNSVTTGMNVSLQGRGAGKKVQFTYISDIDVAATNVLEIYAYADAASVSTLITASSVVIRRNPI